MPHHLIHPILLAHAGATLAMAGLIWFVQVVHYPLMAGVSQHSFATYARHHQQRTTLVVAPLMLAEAVTAAMLAYAVAADTIPSGLATLGLILLAVVWGSTFTIQVPLHARLARGFDHAAWKRLVLSNWIRTIAWTGRGLVALLLLSGHDPARPGFHL